MLKYVNHDIVFQEFPDEVTLALNLSRCPNACPGCHSEYLKGDCGEELTPARLLALVGNYRGEITCVGFMGGDGDPAAVEQLARLVRDEGLRTGWYSGRQELPEGFDATAFSYVKLGPWRSELGPLSDRRTNQRLYRVEPDGKFSDITSRFWR